jgi:hypothetical protein
MSRLLDTLPHLVVQEQVQRLARAFPGRHADLDGFISELRSALQGWSPDELTTAVGEVIREERTFPRIATIIRHRPERRVAERQHAAGGCAVCGEMPYLAGYEKAGGGVIGRIRCGCPAFNTGGWITPAAEAWTAEHREDAA